MPGNRIKYLLTLLVSLCVYILYGEWLAWVLLTAVAALPWLSLILTLPAILSFQLSPTGVTALNMGEDAELWLLGSCAMPMPPFRGKIRLRQYFTEESRRYHPEKGFSTAHCAGYRASVERDRVCDYLGLFSFRVRHRGEQRILVRPVPVPVSSLPELKHETLVQWQPKAGGGFSEEHDLRPFRPGDSLNGVHWKLSAKTGNLIVREPLEPSQSTALLTMTLRGTPEELDRKFGRLLWVGQYLLEQQVYFSIRVLTARGILTQYVGNADDLTRAIDQLLCQRTVDRISIQDQHCRASWQYHIGGAPDEA